VHFALAIVIGHRARVMMMMMMATRVVTTTRTQKRSSLTRFIYRTRERSFSSSFNDDAEHFDEEATVTAERAFLLSGVGTVSRRASLSKRLHFVDVIDVKSNHIYYLKMLELNVSKLVRPGAIISFTGHVCDNSRAELDAGKAREGTYLETTEFKVIEKADAKNIVNAQPFLRESNNRTNRLIMPTSTAVCRTFIAGSECNDPFCAKMHYADEDVLERIKQSRVKAAKRGKLYAKKTAYTGNENDDDDDDDEQQHPTKNKLKKAEAERLFATFLCETFPNAKTFVDIAGGSGILSYELNIEKRRSVILWEPRSIALTKIQGKIKNARRRAWSSSSSNSDRSEDKVDTGNININANADAIEKWIRLENWLLVAKEEEKERLRQHEKRVLAYTNLGSDGDIENPDFETYYEKKYDAQKPLEIFPKKPAVHVPESILEGLDDDRANVETSKTSFEHIREEFWGVNERTRNKLESACVLVGLHSDQATECIVDAALELNKPFAVVPCCVFPSMFPNRKTRDGNVVTSQKEFVQYLLDKDNGIKVSFLNFEGRNCVVYKQ
jgi:hypothetical protein